MPPQALVMLEQCHDVAAKVRRSTRRIGVSVSLTYMLALLEQCLERVEILLNMVMDDDDLRYKSIGLLLRISLKQFTVNAVSVPYWQPIVNFSFASHRKCQQDR